MVGVVGVWLLMCSFNFRTCRRCQTLRTQIARGHNDRAHDIDVDVDDHVEPANMYATADEESLQAVRVCTKLFQAPQEDNAIDQESAAHCKGTGSDGESPTTGLDRISG